MGAKVVDGRMDGEMMVVIKQYFMAKRDYKMDYIGLTGLHGGYY